MIRLQQQVSRLFLQYLISVRLATLEECISAFEGIRKRIQDDQSTFEVDEDQELVNLEEQVVEHQSQDPRRSTRTHRHELDTNHSNDYSGHSNRESMKVSVAGGQETDSLLDFLPLINQQISFFDLEIRQMHDPFNGMPLLSLCNINGDEIAQMATHLTAIEIKFFKSLVEQLMRNSDDTFEISSTEALNICHDIGNVSKKDSESLLEKLVQSSWLSERDGKYCLGIRSAAELSRYLKSEYRNTFYRCYLCKEVALNDHERCDTIDCTVKLHIHCRENYFQKVHQRKCPECHKDWVYPQSRVFKKERMYVMEEFDSEVNIDNVEQSNHQGEIDNDRNNDLESQLISQVEDISSSSEMTSSQLFPERTNSKRLRVRYSPIN